jgi:DNA-binding transcriptional LysR family regulator
MNWDDFRIISAICRAGSFSRAARALQIDETTVGRRLARLESDAGARLFEAIDGVRRPTGTCQAILRQLDDMEKAADDIRRILREGDHAQRTLRLSTIAAIAEYWLAPGLPALLAENPELTLRVETSDRNIDMSRWEADFALRMGRPARGAFLMRRVGQIGFSRVGPRGRVPKQAMLLAYPAPLEHTPEMGALRAIAGDREPRVETSDLNLMRALVLGGEGVAILPDPLVRDLAEDAAIEVTPLPIRREVWLLSQSHLRDDSLARAVAEWCAGLFTVREGEPDLQPKDDVA